MKKDSKLPDFVHKLTNSQWARPEEPNKSLYGVGVVVTETTTQAKQAVQELNELMNAAIVSLSKDSLSEVITTVNKAGKSLIILIEEDLDQESLEVLKKLSDYNDVSPYMAIERIPQNPKTRFVAVISRDVWQKMSYPYFIDMFGVVCRLDTDTN